MAIHSIRSRSVFDPSEVVQLKQTCFAPGRLFVPGEYRVDELPDVAFEMGLVERLPKTEGQPTQKEDTQSVSENES